MAASVHVHIPTTSDEGTIVAWLGEFAGLEEEMDVQTGELACGEAKAAGCGREPSLPSHADIMVANIGWIGDEQGRAGDRRQGEVSIVDQVYSEAIGKTEYNSVGA